jgi:hypothetical protein
MNDWKIAIEDDKIALTFPSAQVWPGRDGAKVLISAEEVKPLVVALLAGKQVVEDEAPGQEPKPGPER